MEVQEAAKEQVASGLDHTDCTSAGQTQQDFQCDSVQSGNLYNIAMLLKQVAAPKMEAVRDVARIRLRNGPLFERPNAIQLKNG